MKAENRQPAVYSGPEHCKPVIIIELINTQREK